MEEFIFKPFKSHVLFHNGSFLVKIVVFIHLKNSLQRIERITCINRKLKCLLEASGLLGQNWGLAVSHARLKSVSGAEGHKATSAPRELISLSRLFRFSHKVLAFSFKFMPFIDLAT